jgi:hypothetical protein
MKIRLPLSNGWIDYELNRKGPLPAIAAPPPVSRVAYAAAHVVVDPSAQDPANVIDMEATLAFRRYLWSLGFGVAEAVDTAQRGMGLDWNLARQLIRLSSAEARSLGARIVCGANTDQLAPSEATLDAVRDAYQEQCEWIESSGGQVILMASRALRKCARGPDDYVKVYGHLLSQLERPAILHWLGEAFDPALKGYWGGQDASESMAILLDLIRSNASRVEGVKISLLDAQKEIEMRRLLPSRIRMYTGDDFHYPELILGDESGRSDALLGILDGIAPAASLALRALDRGDVKSYQELLAPTLPLSRHIFQAPTYYYKTGLVFLAYLNGHQNHFRMLNGLEAARTTTHLAELFVLADQARLLIDPELAVARMNACLAGAEASAERSHA